MSTAVKISDKLVKEAKRYSKIDKRSLTMQIEYWASIGKCAEENPELSKIEYKETRKYLVKRFPYKVIYLVENNKLIILGVLHCKRNPDYINERTDRV